MKYRICLALNVFFSFLGTCVYLWGNLPVRLATWRKFNLALLATICDSVWPGLKSFRISHLKIRIQNLRRLMTKPRLDFQPLWESGDLSSWCGARNAGSQNGWKSSLDQTGMFSFRVRPLLCKWKNQSGTKTFHIRHKSGTIFCSINPV